VDGTNADLELNTIAALAGYLFPFNDAIDFSIEAGGAEMIRISKDFPMKLYNPNPTTSSGDYILYTLGAYSDIHLAFPVELNITFKPFKIRIF
jgi:hypothetical protein